MSDETTGSSPFNRWWIVAAGVIVLILVALVLILTGALGTQSVPPPASPSNTSQPTTVPPNSAEVCEVPGANEAIPVDGPQAAWETNVYFLYPTSAEFGPLPNPASSLWGCFQKSPTGALFASANLFSGLLNDNYVEVANEAILPGAALDAWLAEREGQPTGQDAGRVAQVAGFRFLSVDEDQITLELAFKQSDIEGSMTFTMGWDSATENWKLTMDQSSLSPVSVDLDAGFTPWSAG